MKCCEFCGKAQGAFHHTLRAVICEPCLVLKSRQDAAFDRRCDEDSDFEDSTIGEVN